MTRIDTELQLEPIDSCGRRQGCNMTNIPNPLWTGLARYGSDRDALAIELAKAREELAKLKRQLTKSREQLKKVQVKRDHHLRERDRYRDLYTEAQKRIAELILKTPGF